MSPMRTRQVSPTLRQILSGLVVQSSNDGWTLRKAMEELHLCLDEYDAYLGDAMGDVLTITKANEDEADAREALREQAEEWEGRNNA